MRKNDQSIYLWSFFIVSAIVLSFLYTPIGGKLNNGSDGYYIETAPSVNFGGHIANSPKRRSNYQSHSPGANDAPQAVSLNSYMSQRPVVGGGGATQNTNVNAGNGYSAKGLGFSSSAGSGNGGGTGMMAVSGGGRSQSSENTGGGGGGGMMAPFSSDGISTSGPMKAANEDDFIGADPGGGGPIGNPIPIGDGTWVLLLFAGIYLIIKNKAKL